SELAPQRYIATLAPGQKRTQDRKILKIRTASSALPHHGCRLRRDYRVHGNGCGFFHRAPRDAADDYCFSSHRLGDYGLDQNPVRHSDQTVIAVTPPEHRVIANIAYFRCRSAADFRHPAPGLGSVPGSGFGHWNVQGWKSHCDGDDACGYWI